MLSGWQVQGSIDEALEQAQQEAAVIDREVAHLTERLLQLREDEGATYKTLARLRLDAMTGSGLIRALSSADERARALLAKRQANLNQLDQTLAKLNAESAELSARRVSASKVVEERAQALAVAEKAVREALGETDAYRQQFAATEKATQTARFAEQKTSLAEKDRSVKGKPYQDDPLFMYLWERRYGTSEYRAGFISRLLDRLVARLCEYDQARANYSMLMEIPRRLAEHAERQRAHAETERARLREMEEAALQKDEVVTLRQDVKQAQEKLDAVEDQLEGVERKTAEVHQVKTALTRGDDDVTREAVAAIESSLRREELHELREAAIGTPFDEDDVAVRRLEAIEAERARVEAALETQKAIQSAQRRRFMELEQVRHEYRRGGYGNDRWDFGSNNMLSILLGEMLRGAITRDVFWDSMHRHQRPGPRGPFDYDAGGSIGWPDVSGGGSFDIPDSFGGGDFRTGGSF